MNIIFANLSMSDFLILAWVILVFGGGAAMLRPKRPELVRIERKLDLLLQHHGLQVPIGLSPEVQRLAANPESKIAAIKLHREQTGLGLAEAKAEIEDFCRSLPKA